MKNFKFLFLAFLALPALVITGCKNEDDTPSETNTEVSFEFGYTVNDGDFQVGQVYTIGGTAVQIDVLNFYVGGIELHPEEGEHTHVEGKYLLVKPDVDEYEVTEVKSGHYHEIKFFVGVAPEENSQTEEDFTSRNADDPLAIQDPTMHWSWNSGYKFLRIDGKVDTDGDGTPETPMAMHLGNDDMLKNLEFPAHHDIEGDHTHLHFHFNINELLDGIDLSTDYSTHTGDNLPLATKLRDNLSKALGLE
ncbi:MAG TPA: hypothetical protein PKA00_05600 [Saprospiraceae bacterium]|nr:hypothetical protein [Saprospiraceae bacterium]HMQ82356.1 hypothetical protein [Saprospiraceae bacterium]